MADLHQIPEEPRNLRDWVTIYADRMIGTQERANLVISIAVIFAGLIVLGIGYFVTVPAKPATPAVVPPTATSTS